MLAGYPAAFSRQPPFPGEIRESTLTVGKKGLELLQHLGQGIFQHIMPGFREVMALCVRKTSAPFGIELIIKAEITTAPADKHGLVVKLIQGIFHPTEAVPGRVIGL